MTALYDAEESEVLGSGEIDIRGRVVPASNLTFLGDVTHQGGTLPCVYKPVSGERPLWDFPDGTLAAREVAAYVVSGMLGWDIVPLTILRDGPFGYGMVQVWKEPDQAQRPVDVRAHGSVPDGYLHVLDAVDSQDHPVSLVHEDSVALRRMAVFDVVVNNADRKGGHVLAMLSGHRFGVDHGVCFHEENKLRTVLWGWADQPLHPDDLDALTRLGSVLEAGSDPAARRLAELLDAAEIAALRRRCRTLVTESRMPVPSHDWPAIPWPAF